EAAKNVPSNSIVVSVDISQYATGSSFNVNTVYLPDLAEPDLTSAGLLRDAVDTDLREQVLDYLDRTYTFALPAPAVERELAAIWQAAQDQGLAAEAAADEFRLIAERRVRL